MGLLIYCVLCFQASTEWHALAFALHHVIDSMVTFGLRDQGSLVLQLANLLFTVLLR